MIQSSRRWPPSCPGATRWSGNLSKRAARRPSSTPTRAAAPT
nr:MAG TPA: hypothetical protein [Caudoviricetes sp.]